MKRLLLAGVLLGSIGCVVQKVQKTPPTTAKREPRTVSEAAIEVARKKTEAATTALQRAKDLHETAERADKEAARLIEEARTAEIAAEAALHAEKLADQHR